MESIFFIFLHSLSSVVKRVQIIIYVLDFLFSFFSSYIYNIYSYPVVLLSLCANGRQAGVAVMSCPLLCIYNFLNKRTSSVEIKCINLIKAKAALLDV